MIYNVKQDFPALRNSGQLAAKVLDHITPYVKPAVSTSELDAICNRFIENHGGKSAALNYRGFPKATCISVNHVVCHGIPNENKILQEGDILNIDVAVELDGWYGDTSRMYHVGKVERRATRLVQKTYECLMAGIARAKPDAYLGDIGAAIASKAKNDRLAVVEDYCGHGIGRTFHEPPNVLHFAKAGTGIRLQPGMVFTIEPMINLGKKDVVTLPDKWTVITRDRQLSAQFEHSVGITEDGCEIFTASPQNLSFPPYPEGISADAY